MIVLKNISMKVPPARNEVVGFRGLIFSLVILNDLILKCVIAFGRLVGILNDQWKW
jgi:hypothetical protein